MTPLERMVGANLSDVLSPTSFGSVPDASTRPDITRAAQPKEET